ncbi:CHASE3 domain sensor protein [Nitrobacteraceae bacterium AZCC 2146]
MLAKLSIRLKLIAVISFLLVALAGIGSFAVNRMQELNSHTVDLATNWLPSVQILGELQVLVQRYRNNVSLFVLMTDQQERRALEKLLDSIAQEMNQAFKTYDPLVTSPEERRLADEIARDWKEFLSLTQEAMDAVRKDNDVATARDLVVTKITSLSRKMAAAPKKGHRTEQQGG